MSEQRSERVQQLASRYQLASSPDWQTLLTHFDLGEGFAFIVLLVPNNDGDQVCKAALVEYLGRTGKQIFELAVNDPDDLKNLASTLLALQTPGNCGAVWVGAAISNASPDFRLWSEGWRDCVTRVNQIRNTLRRQFDVPLIFVGAPWLQEVLRENAPDLWSVRTLVAWVEPKAGTEFPRTRMPASEPIGRGPDPELAMAEANRLRGQPGKDLIVARLLYRAGLGFYSQYRWHEAGDAFIESLDLRRRSYAPAQDQAESLFCLGLILREALEHDRALEAFSAAQALYSETGDSLGEANCLFWSGVLAFDHSAYETARTKHEQARRLCHDAGNVVGEASCIEKFGDNALLRKDNKTASAHYEQALAMHRRGDNFMGEASCIARLGDVALYSHDYNTAQARYEEGLVLFRRLANVLGEANCVLSLGHLALSTGYVKTALARYNDALQLYRRSGHVLGEANCFQGRGNVATYEGEVDRARKEYELALDLYTRLQEPYSIGTTHRDLARISSTNINREEHIAEAREAWASIGRQDLIDELDREFIHAPVG